MRDHITEDIDDLFELAGAWAVVDDQDACGIDEVTQAVFAQLQRTPPHLLALLTLSAYVDTHRMRALEEMPVADPALVRARVLDALERDHLATQLRWRHRE